MPREQLLKRGIWDTSWRGKLYAWTGFGSGCCTPRCPDYTGVTRIPPQFCLSLDGPRDEHSSFYLADTLYILSKGALTSYDSDGNRQRRLPLPQPGLQLHSPASLEKIYLEGQGRHYILTLPDLELQEVQVPKHHRFFASSEERLFSYSHTWKATRYDVDEEICHTTPVTEAGELGEMSRISFGDYKQAGSRLPQVLGEWKHHNSFQGAILLGRPKRSRGADDIAVSYSRLESYCQTDRKVEELRGNLHDGIAVASGRGGAGTVFFVWIDPRLRTLSCSGCNTRVAAESMRCRCGLKTPLCGVTWGPWLGLPTS